MQKLIERNENWRINSTELRMNENVYHPYFKTNWSKKQKITVAKNQYLHCTGYQFLQKI